MMSISISLTLPARLSRLSDLANDLWWTWNPAREVFRKLDYRLWRETAHNPVMMLNRLSLAALETARSHSTPTWWQQTVGTDPSHVVAYFCAEFALHQSLPIYAGGLGVLAGDHCK